MQNLDSILRFDSRKSCFVALTKDLVEKCLNRNLTFVKISSPSSILYSSVLPVPLQDATATISVSGLFANKQGFHHEQKVQLTFLDAVASCSQVFVEPLTVDDWEILELNASLVETTMLDAVRIVFRDQVFPIWIQKICVFLKVCAIEPSDHDCVLLEAQSEVHITPKYRGGTNFVSTTAVQTQGDPLEEETNASEDTDPDKMPSTGDSDQASSPGDPSHRYDNSLASDESSVHLSRDQRTRDGGRSNELLQPSQTMNKASSWWNPLQGLGTLWSSVLPVSSTDMPDCHQLAAKECLSQPWKAMCRIQPAPEHYEECNTVFISDRSFQQNCDATISPPPSNYFFAVLRRLSSPKEKEQEEKEAHEKKKRAQPGRSAAEKRMKAGVVRVKVVRGVNKLLPLNTVIIPDSLRQTLRLSATSRVLLTAIMSSEVQKRMVTEGEFHISPTSKLPDKLDNRLVEACFTSWLEEQTNDQSPEGCVLLRDGTVARLRLPLLHEPQLEVITTVKGSQPNSEPIRAEERFCLVRFDWLGKAWKVVVKEKEVRPPPSLNLIDPSPPVACPQPLRGMSALLNHCIYSLSFTPCTTLHSRTPGGAWGGGALVAGPRGVGKRTLAHGVAAHLAEAPFHCFVQPLLCSQLRGKRVESIRHLLDGLLQELIWRQPSILILEHLDHLCPALAGPEQEASPDAQYSAHVAAVVKDLISSVTQSSPKLVVVATINDRISLHPLLCSSRGNHLFQHVVDLPAPNQEERKTFLGIILPQLPDHDLDVLSSRTEGYVARDLVKVVKRAKVISASTPDQELNFADLEASLKDFVPVSLIQADLHSPGDVGWEQVGGMEDIRTTLEQTLLWPAKYPQLFAHCPLRLRSGLLLYGAPGTGKTLIAGAAAKESGLNFITVKGPELLSKYIGASEMAVRNVFQRAQSAKPCILFFDEFDSLAPRRGHDNTGVTDRVVNQLLTELDGVKSLTGVYLLAATSRPDLIDPALLRPGRLDQAIYCPLPDQNTRTAILECLLRCVPVCTSVTAEWLAAKCEGLTGADMKALLYNAQLAALHSARSGQLPRTDASPVLHEEILEKTHVPVHSLVSGSSSEHVNTYNLTFIESLEEGVQQLDENTENRVREQLAPLLKNGPSSRLTAHDMQAEAGEAAPSQAPNRAPVITTEFIESSIQELRPSVTREDREKYQQIYERFATSRGASFSGELSELTQKATLA